MAAARILSRSLLSKLNRPPRLLALSAVSSVSTTHSPSSAFASRFLSTRTASSSLKDSNPNWSNRPPKETILLDGCDFEHWLVVVEKPEGDPTRDEIIDSYVKTLAMVVGSEEEARMKLYSVSTRHYFAFGCLVSEELSYKIKELPRVCWVLPDSYLHVQTKDYGGEPVINGVPVPYDPKYHEEWVKNHNHARDRNDRNNNRTRRRDNNIQSRNFPRNVPMTNTQSSVGGPQNNMSGPHSHTDGPPQNTGGTPPYTGGYQPNNAGGYQPNHAGGYQPNHAGGYQPNHTGGYQPNNRGGFPPNNAGEMPPNNTGGYQTNNIGSFQQNNMGGMPPNNANQPPRDMGGYQSNNTGVIPQNNMGGLQPSNMGAMPNNAASQPNREYSNQGPYMNSSPSNRDFQNDYSQSSRGIPSGGNTHQQ